MFQKIKTSTFAALGSTAAAGAVALLPAVSHAAPVDLTSLTAAVDFSTASSAILSVAGSLIVVYIAIKASMFVIRMVRGG